MLISDLLSLFDEVHDIVDVTPKQADITRHLRLPEGSPLDARGLKETADLAPGPGTLLISLLGPDAETHSDPDALAALLRRMRPGAQALLLIGWPVDELPYHRLIGPLVDGACQVIEAVPLDRVAGHDVHCALAVRCVDAVAPPRTWLMDIRPERPAPAGPDGWQPDEPHGTLRLVNEYVLADLLTRPVRRRAAELEQQASDLNQRLARLTARLDLLESSVSYQVGRLLVSGLRHPGRGLVSAPRDVAKVWRSARLRRRGAPPAVKVAAAPVTRVVPIALPPSRPGREPGLLTMTAPSRLLVPRKLAENGLGGYEPGALACFLAAIDVAGPGAVLDIGANVGIYAGLAGGVTDRDVVAFEPTPALADVARALSDDNGLGYTVETLALGSENGTATFFLSDSSDTSNSLAAGFRSSSVTIEVPVETLDSYLARTGLVPAVMKVDTETTEPDVLRGATKAIAEHRPWILCEVLAGRVEAPLTEVMEPLGYHWYHVTEQIPYTRADEITGDKTYKYLMWLFAPEEPTGEFWTVLRRRTAALAACTTDRGIEQ